MEVDEELLSADNSRCNSRSSNSGGRFVSSPLGLTRTVQGMVLNRGLGLRSHRDGEFAVPDPPGSSATLPHPSKLNLLSGRRSSSGIFLTNMFSSRFRHLQKLHTDGFLLGLNGVSYPALPKGTMFRSSLPATPVSTPIYREGFKHFTEQEINERLCKTPSPRKRGISPSSSHSTSSHQQQQSHPHPHHHPHPNQYYLTTHQYRQSSSSSSKQLNYDDDSYSSDHCMDTTSPVPPPISILDDTLLEGGSDLSESESVSLPSTASRRSTRSTKEKHSAK